MHPALSFILPCCEHVFFSRCLVISRFFSSQTKISQAVGDKGQISNPSTISSDGLKHNLRTGVFDWHWKACSSQSCRKGLSRKRGSCLFSEIAPPFGQCLHHSNYLPALQSLSYSVLGIEPNNPHMLGQHPYLWITPQGPRPHLQTFGRDLSKETRFGWRMQPHTSHWTFTNSCAPSSALRALSEILPIQIR